MATGPGEVNPVPAASVFLAAAHYRGGHCVRGTPCGPHQASRRRSSQAARPSAMAA